MYLPMPARRAASPNSTFREVQIGKKIVAVDEDVVLRKPFGQLKRFRKVDVEDQGPKLLIVAPMSGHFATLLRGTVAAHDSQA